MYRGLRLLDASSGFALALLSCVGCATTTAGTNTHSAPAEDPSALAARAKQQLGSIADLPSPEVNALQASLGRRLFFEKSVSADGTIGCISCHGAEHGGADGLPKSKGVFGRDNPRNAPTVWNAATQVSEHWRADRESVEDQAKKALLGKPAFGLESNEQAVEKLRAIPGLSEQFEAAFPDAKAAVSVESWGTAIGQYERTLRATSPFDAFLAGDAAALSTQAQRGLSAFLDLGCARCHGGPLLGGAATKKFGLFADYWTLTNSDPIDNGRFDVTQNEADRYVFKVPPLRNVARTAPYFHDGSVVELDRAVAIMARTQLGQTLDPAVVQDLVALLRSLSTPAPETYSAP